MNRYERPFAPDRPSSALAGFDSSFGQTALAVALESGGRAYTYPSARVIRLAETSGVDYKFALGTSDSTAIGSTNGTRVLGGTVELFHVEPGLTHIQLISTSTFCLVNLTIGAGQ